MPEEVRPWKYTMRYSRWTGKGQDGFEGTVNGDDLGKVGTEYISAYQLAQDRCQQPVEANKPPQSVK